MTLRMGYSINSAHEPYSPLHDSQIHTCVAALRADAPGLNTMVWKDGEPFTISNSLNLTLACSSSSTEQSLVLK